MSTITIDDITHWLVLSGGIGHVLTQSNSGWHSTACGLWTPNGRVVTERPKRKCRACVRQIPALLPHPETRNTTDEDRITEMMEKMLDPDAPPVSRYSITCNVCGEHIELQWRVGKQYELVNVTCSCGQKLRIPIGDRP